MREIIRQKIVDGTASAAPPLTRRDVSMPRVPGKAKAVIGMRRTGKTTFLWQVMADRLAGGMPREGILYFNFEDERLVGMTGAELNLLVEEYFRLYPERRDRRETVFLLDEIQVAGGWEAFARRLIDEERVELFLSGSSARLLSREVATSMRGRALEVLIYPFSFREYLRHLGREPGRSADRLPRGERSRLQKDLDTYLRSGGFPESVGLSLRERTELLRSYIDVAILRDVIERHDVSHPVALHWLVRSLLGSPAGAFSINRFHRDLRSQGFALGKDSLHAWLGHLEDAFLVRTLWLATDSERRRMVNPRKAYPIDPGLIPVYDRSGRSNIGHALETCVLLELDRRGVDTAYIRTGDGFEVDFLARYPEGREELIQVSADISEPATLEREIRALLSAKEEYPRAAPVLITLDVPPRLSLPDEIRVRPAVEWLLEG